jgi:hypothetical protein
MTSEGGHSTRTSFGDSGGKVAPGLAIIPGSSEESFHLDRNDLLTNPIYSHLPANIFYSRDEDIASTDIESEIVIDTVPDYITDPIYSYMPGNIYYSDDIDDPFEDSSGIHSTTSSIDDDIGTCSTPSLFDDDWHSSSFDDD